MGWTYGKNYHNRILKPSEIVEEYVATWKSLEVFGVSHSRNCSTLLAKDHHNKDVNGFFLILDHHCTKSEYGWNTLCESMGTDSGFASLKLLKMAERKNIIPNCHRGMNWRLSQWQRFKSAKIPKYLLSNKTK
jgi:hypothetical protein